MADHEDVPTIDVQVEELDRVGEKPESPRRGWESGGGSGLETDSAGQQLSVVPHPYAVLNAAEEHHDDHLLAAPPRSSHRTASGRWLSGAAEIGKEVLSTVTGRTSTRNGHRNSRGEASGDVAVEQSARSSDDGAPKKGASGLSKLKRQTTAMIGASRVQVAAISQELISYSSRGEIDNVQHCLKQKADIEAQHRFHQRTPLIMASSGGHEEVVQVLLKARANVEAKGKLSGQTATMWAAMQGHAAVVRCLIDSGANVNQADLTEEMTALMKGALEGHDEVVQTLLEGKADTGAKDKLEKTALIHASYEGHLAVVQHLLAFRSELEAKGNQKGQTALMWACEGGHMDVVACLLEAHADTGAVDKLGKTSLIHASRSGHHGVVKQLLDAKADKEAGNSKMVLTSTSHCRDRDDDKEDSRGCEEGDGRTALIWASECGHLEVVNELLDRSADTKAVDARHRRTPLIWASMNGHADIVSLLLRAGAAQDQKDKHDETPLMHAANQGHADVARSLLKAKADLNETDDVTKGPVLVRAALKGHADVVRRLLEARAQIEAPYEDPLTDLMEASLREGNSIRHLSDAAVDTVKATAKAASKAWWRGDSSKCSNNNNDNNNNNPRTGNSSEDKALTSLMGASLRGEVDVVETLLEARADMEREDKFGYTALIHAALGGSAEVIKLLLKRSNGQNVEQLVSMLPLSCPCRRDALESYFKNEPDVPSIGPARAHFEGPLTCLTPGPHKGKMHEWFADNFGWQALWDKRVKNYASQQIVVFRATDPTVVCADLVEALSIADLDSDVWQSQMTHAILNHAWERCYRWFFLFDLLMQLGMLAVVISATSHVRNESRVPKQHIAAAAALMAKLLLEEFAQCTYAMVLGDRKARNDNGNISLCGRVVNVAHELLDEFWGNLSDYVYLGVGCLALYSLGETSALSWEDNEKAICLLSLWVFATTMGIIMSVRAFTPFGPHVAPITKSIMDGKEFTLVMFAVLMAFAFAFYVMGTREVAATIDDAPEGLSRLPATSPMYASFLPIYRLGVMGDFDVFELEGASPIFEPDEHGNVMPMDPTPTKKYAAVHILFYGVSCLVSIIMMNLFVGILSAAYDRYEDQSKKLFLHQRANIITNLNNIPWICWAGQRWAWPKKPEKDKQSGSDGSEVHFYFSVRESEQDTDHRSTRQAMKRHVDKKVRPLQRGFDELGKKVIAMETMMEEIKNMLDKRLPPEQPEELERTQTGGFCLGSPTQRNRRASTSKTGGASIKSAASASMFAQRAIQGKG